MPGFTDCFAVTVGGGGGGGTMAVVTRTWLVFAKDTPDSTMRWHLARNTDIYGHYTSIPLNLQAQADEEKWKLPYLYTETVEVPNGEG